nr:MAG TPA: hypothetical protein [Caudoviricetes sp.]
MSVFEVGVIQHTSFIVVSTSDTLGLSLKSVCRLTRLSELYYYIGDQRPNLSSESPFFEWLGCQHLISLTIPIHWVSI